jgi:hypothetical protein
MMGTGNFLAASAVAWSFIKSTHQGLSLLRLGFDFFGVVVDALVVLEAVAQVHWHLQQPCCAAAGCCDVG